MNLDILNSLPGMAAMRRAQLDSISSECREQIVSLQRQMNDIGQQQVELTEAAQPAIRKASAEAQEAMRKALDANAVVNRLHMELSVKVSDLQQVKRPLRDRMAQLQAELDALVNA